MINKDIPLAIFGKAIVENTFGECFRPYTHTISFMSLVSGYESYFKMKLFDIKPKIVFPKYIDNIKTGNSIDFDMVAKEVKKNFIHEIDKSFLVKIKKERNSLFHFSEKEIDSEVNLKFLFNIIIPFIEKYFPEDIDVIIDYALEYDDAVVENYLIERLEQYDIKYSESIKKKFSYEK